MLKRFLPRDEQFFAFFKTAVTNAAATAEALAALLNSTTDIDGQVQAIRGLEHRGDEITHQIFQALNSTFVTPLDREDIQSLASTLDDFVDYIEEVAKRFRLYRIEQPTQLSQSLAAIIVQQAQHLVEAFPLLENPKYADTIRKLSVEINRLENEADDVLSQALAGLYDGANDIPSLVQAIRWGELYQMLEDASDRAEDVANTLEAIVLKYA